LQYEAFYVLSACLSSALLFLIFTGPKDTQCGK
jgi:hypothetical protein